MKTILFILLCIGFVSCGNYPISDNGNLVIHSKETSNIPGRYKYQLHYMRGDSFIDNFIYYSDSSYEINDTLKLRK